MKIHDWVGGYKLACGDPGATSADYYIYGCLARGSLHGILYRDVVDIRPGGRPDTAGPAAQGAHLPRWTMTPSPAAVMRETRRDRIPGTLTGITGVAWFDNC